VIAADQADIEQEVAEAAARLRMNSPKAPTTPKRPRSMI
jgi:hypothetical protein